MSTAANSDAGGTLRRAVEKAPRRTGLRAVMFFGVAVVAALGTAFLLIRYLEARTQAARVPTTGVVVAANDLPAATTLREEALAVVQWPSVSLPQGVASEATALVGRVLISPVVKGEPILEQRLASPDAGRGLSAILPPGMRAVAVRVNDVVGVAGFVHPGDSVDVIVTMNPGNSSTPTSKIILQDIRVIAVGQEVERKDRNHDKSMPATVATLMVDPEQSEKLALAASKGEILLSLRSAIDDEQLVTPGIVPPRLLAGEMHAVATPSAAPVPVRSVRRAPPPPKIEPQAEKKVVEILRGDMFEQRDFAKRSGM